MVDLAKNCKKTLCKHMLPGYDAYIYIYTCIYAPGGFVGTHEAKQGEPWLFYFQVVLLVQ